MLSGRRLSFGVGHIIKVEVIEHLIITPKSFLSFVDTGLMEELEKSVKFMPPYKIVQTIRKKEKKLREEAVQNTKLEIAKTMKSDAVLPDLIMKFTGFPKSEIDKL